jgi:uncharacterized membrane protein
MGEAFSDLLRFFMVSLIRECPVTWVTWTLFLSFLALALAAPQFPAAKPPGIRGYSLYYELAKHYEPELQGNMNPIDV